MSSVDHSISIALVNKLKLPISITIYVNDQIKIKQNFLDSGNYILAFEHDYQDQAINVLKIQFRGQEQQSKQMTLKQIIINGQQLQVNSGFYVPDKNKWWKHLGNSELQSNKEKYFCHGGELGWFGSIIYEYVDKKQRWHMTDPWTFNRRSIFL